MKVLMISHKHPPSLGGMETQSFYIAEGIRENHKLVEIIYKEQESRLLWFLKLKRRVKKTLKEHRDIDIIHLNDGLMAFLCHWLPELTSIPVVTTFHGLDLIFPSKIYQKRLQKFRNQYSICVSKATNEAAIARGFSPSKTIHINNGVNHTFGSDIDAISNEDLNELIMSKINGQDILLFSVGRAVPRKGYNWFAKEVLSKMPDNVKYLVIGPNNVDRTLRIILGLLPSSWGRFLATLNGWTVDYAPLKQAQKDPSLKGKLFVLDKMPFDKMVGIMKRAHAMVMPNIPYEGDMEGFGLVILEANMAEKFVFGSDIEGIQSAIIPNQNGKLIPTLQSEKWLNTLLEYLDQSRLTRLGHHAKVAAQEEYNWSKMVDEYIAYFSQIISSK